MIAQRLFLVPDAMSESEFHSEFSHLHGAFTPRQWLGIVLASAMLAAFSGYILWSRMDKVLLDVPSKWYDRAEIFVLDTIRLSFSRRKLLVRDASVFVAPKGILEKDATFNWLEDAAAITQMADLRPALPVAPPQLLDPDWKPDFPGITAKTKEAQ